MTPRCDINQRFITKRRHHTGLQTKTCMVMETLGDFSLSCQSSKSNDKIHRRYEEELALKERQRQQREQEELDELFDWMYLTQEREQNRRVLDY